MIPIIADNFDSLLFQSIVLELEHCFEDFSFDIWVYIIRAK